MWFEGEFDLFEMGELVIDWCDGSFVCLNDVVEVEVVFGEVNNFIY